MHSSTDLLVFPIGALIKSAFGGRQQQQFGAPPPLLGASLDPAARLALSAVLAIILIGTALWMASESGGDVVNYVLALFFPLNYIIVKLLA